MRKVFACLSVLGAAAGLLTGCATAPPPPAPPPSSSENATDPLGDRGQSRGTSPWRSDLLPLLEVKVASHEGDAPMRIGGYTRFYIEGALHERGTQVDGSVVARRRYSEERRGWMGRWLVGRSLSRVLAVKVSLSQPDISATTTLASATHQSNRVSGESWSTEVNGRRMLTPYFRVDPTTTVSIETTINASAAMQGDVGGTVLDVMNRAATLLAPSSTLVTALTEQRLEDASQFVDQSISALFAETLAERSTSEFGPGDWHSNLVTIDAYFPGGQLSDDQHSHIGEWRVQAEPAIVSIFSRTPLCAESGPCDPMAQARTAFADLAPYTVLNFRLGDNQTLGQVLRGDPTVAAALTALNGAEANARAREAADLCNVVAGKVEALGFNRFDAAAAVWAVSESDMVAAGRSELQAAATCEASRLFASVRRR